MTIVIVDTHAGFVQWIGKAADDEEALALYATEAGIPDDRDVSGNWEDECDIYHVDDADVPIIEAWIAAGHPSIDTPACLI